MGSASGRARFGKRLQWTAAAVAVLVLLFCFFFFWGGSKGAAPKGVFLYADPREELSILSMEEQSGGVALACCKEGGYLLFRLDAATGQVLAQRSIGTPAYWAALRQETLFVREDLPSGSVLVGYDPDTLEEVSRRQLGWLPDDLLFFDCSASGSAFCVLDKERNLLRVSPPEGKERTEEFSEEVEFLGTEGEALYAWSGGSLSVFEGWEVRKFPCRFPPFRLLGGGRLLDREGVVSVLEETGLSAQFQCAEPLYDGPFFCLDRENCLILSDGGSGVIRYGPAGQPEGSCFLEEAPLGICAAGGVYRKEGGLYYGAFPFSSASPKPSPEPSPMSAARPSPEPYPTPEDSPAWIEDGFVLLEAGSTVDQLRELFKPEAVEIRDLAGRLLTRGRLATGMTAGERVIVIKGDCDGSGTVTGADLRQAVTMSLEAGEGPSYRAADLNGDGAVDTADLLALAAMLGSQ